MYQEYHKHFTDGKWIYFVAQNMGNGVNSLMYGVRRTKDPQSPGKPVKSYTFIKSGCVNEHITATLHYFVKREDAEEELIKMSYNKRLKNYNGYISFE